MTDHNARQAGLTKMIADLRAEQSNLAASRDMCGPEWELPRWDALQRVIDYLAAPAAPAPTDECGMTLADWQQVERDAAPAPAAQADDWQAAFNRLCEANHLTDEEEHQIAHTFFQAGLRQQSATPAEPFAWTTDDEREPITNALRSARMDLYGKSYTVPLYRATPADAASEADKRDATRYRWLRDSDRLPEEIDGEIVVGTAGGEDVLFDSALDKAIDAAIQRERQQGEVRA